MSYDGLIGGKSGKKGKGTGHRDRKHTRSEEEIAVSLDLPVTIDEGYRIRRMRRGRDFSLLSSDILQ
jgi:hypothetical protein